MRDNELFLEYQIADYAGISGAVDLLDDTTKERDHANNPMDTSYAGLLVDMRCVRPSGIPCFQAMVWIRRKHVLDGFSKTMLVGEQSDECLDSEGLPQDCRSTSGRMQTGTNGNGGSERGLMTMTTVAHPINTKSWNPTTRGATTPIQSAHPGGAVVGFADTHVVFMPEEMELHVMRAMAVRDEGAPTYSEVLGQ
ncbi:unnamed protein product [marine sediment metagenome]|uniref:DUF1559 domain-containing protein n=1 Tax=marine sediment metagenome TaxID=412755 RepID=X0VQ90_9ZZZZ